MSKKRNAEKSMEITPVERELIEAYNGQINALVAPVQTKLNEHVRRIEQRLGLPQGSIGNTHTIDQSGNVIGVSQNGQQSQAWADPLDTTVG